MKKGLRLLAELGSREGAADSLDELALVVARQGRVGCIYSVPAADLDVLVPIQSSERASLRSGKAAAFTTVSTARLPANLQLEIKPLADTPQGRPSWSESA